MPDLLESLKLTAAGFFERSTGQEGPYLKSPSVAANVFGVAGDEFLNTPLLGFQYYVKIYYNSAAEDFLSGIFGAAGAQNQISPLVKSVSLPSVGITTDTLNEYNRHRINQQRLDFDPVKIVFHDVMDGKTLKLWQAYYQYYFLDGQSGSEAFARGQVTNPKHIGATNPRAFNSGEFGYNLAQVGEEKYLFKKIEIYQVQGRSINRTTMYNPRISSFDHDILSYDSSDAVEVNMTFEYEWVDYAIGADSLRYGVDDRDGPAAPASASTVPDDVQKFFGADLSQPFEMQAFKNFERTDKAGLAGPTVTNSIQAIANSESPLDLVRNVKKEAQFLAAKAASASALFNQVQIDVLGVDEPIVEAPDIRDFTAVINKIPTAYPDIRRVARDIKY